MYSLALEMTRATQDRMWGGEEILIHISVGASACSPEISKGR